MSNITPNLNMILGGIQIAQLPGAAAVEIFNLIHEGRELSLTHEGFEKIGELRHLAQALNIAITPGARRLQAAGAKTELTFSPIDALSLFHVIGENISLRQAELRFVTGRIAVNSTHDEDPDAEEQDLHLEGELVAEIQDQLTDEQIDLLIKEFITEEDEDDEADILLDMIAERHGVEAIIQKIDDLGFEFSSDLDDDAAMGGGAGDEDDEDDAFDGEDDAFDGEEDPDEEGETAPSEYALTVLRNDLTALHHNDRMIIANEIGLNSVGFDVEGLVNEFMQLVPDVLDAIDKHSINVPNYTAVMRSMEEDEDREERLHMLDIQDLEILCDVLGIDRVDQEHDDLIDVLCCRPQSEFESALEIANITLPDLDYSDKEPTVEEWRENFSHIAALTMLQSAVATCIADSSQDLVLSFTH